MGPYATGPCAKEAAAHGIYDKPIDFTALKAEIDQRLAARGVAA
jgi:hypothetical protein